MFHNTSKGALGWLERDLLARKRKEKYLTHSQTQNQKTTPFFYSFESRTKETQHLFLFLRIQKQRNTTLLFLAFESRTKEIQLYLSWISNSESKKHNTCFSPFKSKSIQGNHSRSRSTNFKFKVSLPNLNPFVSSM